MKKTTKKKQIKQKHSICGCIFFCFVECIEVISTHKDDSAT